MNRFLRGLILLIGSIQILVAQTPPSAIRIHGYILDRERKPIPMVSVRLEQSRLGTTSNLRGFYSISLPKGTDSLFLLFSSVGYRPVRKAIPTQTDTLRLNITLVETEQELSGVEVVAGKKDIPNTETLQTDKLYIGGSASGGIESLIGTMKGVSQRNELSGRYNVRGGSFDENLTYINGVEIYRPLLQRSAEQEGLSSINPDMVGSLHFSSGAFSVSYGDKASSVLDIRYKEPQENGGHLMIGLLEGRGYWATKGNRFSQITGLRYKRNTSLLSTLDTKAEYNPLYWDGQTFLTYQITPQLKLSLLGNINSTDYIFIPQSRQTSFGTIQNRQQLSVSFDGQEHDSFHTYLMALGLSYQPSLRTSIELICSGFGSRERERFDITSEYLLSDPTNTSSPSGSVSPIAGIGREREHARNALDYSVLGLTLRGTHLLGSHRLGIGGEVRLERISDDTAEWSSRDSLGFTPPLVSDELRVHRQIHGAERLRTSRLALYLEDRFGANWAEVGRLQVTLGLRSAYWTGNREWLISPRLQLGLTPQGNKNLYYHISSGLYYQSPFYKELRRQQTDGRGNSLYILNRDIRSQGAVSLTAGIDYNFRLMDRPFRLSAEGYYKKLFRLNPYTLENVRLHYLGRNAGDGYVLGLDTKLYGEFVEGVDSWLSFSLTDGRQRIEGNSIPLTNAPRYSISLFYQDYFRGFKPLRLSLRASYSAGVAVMLPERSFEELAFYSAPYRRVDIGVIYRLTDQANGKPHRWWRTRWMKSIDVGLDLLNLFDMTNTNNYYWVTDSYGGRYAVPNYLTRRSVNMFVKVNF